MLIRRMSAEYHNKEREIYDKIRAASDEFARRSQAGADTAEALRLLEAALIEFMLFRGRQT